MGVVPGQGQGLLGQEPAIALKESRQDHLGTMFWSKLRCQGNFSSRLAIEAIDMHLRGTDLHLALESQDVEVLVVAFQEHLCLGSCPLRVVRHINAPYSPEELGDAQERLLHAQGARPPGTGAL